MFSARQTSRRPSSSADTSSDRPLSVTLPLSNTCNGQRINRVAVDWVQRKAFVDSSPYRTTSMKKKLGLRRRGWGRDPPTGPEILKKEPPISTGSCGVVTHRLGTLYWNSGRSDMKNEARPWVMTPKESVLGSRPNNGEPFTGTRFETVLKIIAFHEFSSVGHDPKWGRVGSRPTNGEPFA